MNIDRKFTIMEHTVAVVICALAIVALVMTPSGYGQQQQQQSEQRPPDIKVVESNEITQKIMLALNDISTELTDYKLFENGSAIYTFELAPRALNETMEVHFCCSYHGYGAQQGYIYNSSGVFTPGGGQRLIIATEN